MGGKKHVPGMDQETGKRRPKPGDPDWKMAKQRDGSYVQVGSLEPTPGRCNQTIKGTDPVRYCKGHPVPGAIRCHHHTGTSEVKGTRGHPIVTGRYSERFRQFHKEGQERLEALARDPDLLNVKYTVAALADIILTTIQPADNEVLQALVDRGQAKDLDDARNRHAKQQAGHLKRLLEAQEAANKQARMGELLIQAVQPAFEELGRQIRRLVAYHIQDPTVRASFESDLASALLAATGKVAALGDKV